jgi:hypothetical protein
MVPHSFSYLLPPSNWQLQTKSRFQQSEHFCIIKSAFKYFGIDSRRV